MKIAVQFPIFAYGIRMLRAKVQMHSRISNQIRHTTFSVLPLDGGMWGLWITSSSLRNKLHGNFLSVAVFFFLFNCLFFFFVSVLCTNAWDHVSWTENKNGFSFAFSSSEVPRPTQDIPTRLRTKINNPATAKPTTPSSTNCDVLMHGKLSMPRCIQAASCALYAAGCRHCRRLLISFFRCSFPPLRFDLQMKKERKKKARA